MEQQGGLLVDLGGVGGLPRSFLFAGTGEPSERKGSDRGTRPMPIVVYKERETADASVRPRSPPMHILMKEHWRLGKRAEDVERKWLVRRGVGMGGGGGSSWQGRGGVGATWECRKCRGRALA